MSQTAGKGRIKYVDIFKALAMLFVILGHINFANQNIKAWIYAFHVPAFFFAAGLVVNNTGNLTFRSVGNNAWKYFQRLIIPYILWGLIFAKWSFSNTAKILYGSYAMISGAGSLTSLWFLPVMFLCMILYRLLEWLLKERFSLVAKATLMIAGFAAGLCLPNIRIGYPWSANVALTAFGFLLAGSLVRNFTAGWNQATSDPEKRKTHPVLAILLMILCLAGTMLFRLNTPLRGYVLMGKGEYGNPLLFLAASLSGCGFLYFLSRLFDDVLSGALAQWLSWFGQNTLTVLMVQKPVIAVFKSIFSRIHAPDAVALLITLVGTTAIVCVLCMILNRFAPILVGRQKIPLPSEEGGA